MSIPWPGSGAIESRWRRDFADLGACNSPADHPLAGTFHTSYRNTTLFWVSNEPAQFQVTSTHSYCCPRYILSGCRTGFCKLTRPGPNSRYFSAGEVSWTCPSIKLHEPQGLRYSASGGQHHDLMSCPAGLGTARQKPPTTPTTLQLTDQRTMEIGRFPSVNGYLPHPFTLQSLIAPGDIRLTMPRKFCILLRTMSDDLT